MRELRDLIELKRNKTIVYDGVDNGSSVVVWDREGYIREPEKQLSDTEIYEQVSNNNEPFPTTIRATLEKIEGKLV